MSDTPTTEFLETEFDLDPDKAQAIAGWLEQRDAERGDVAQAVKIKHMGEPAPGVAGSLRLHTYHIATTDVKYGRAKRRWSIEAPDLDTAMVASLSYNRGQSVYCYNDIQVQSRFGLVGKTSLSELITFVVAHERTIRAAFATIKEEQS